MIKQKYPILEFDPDQEAVINPILITKNHKPLDECLVVCFFPDVIETLLNKNEIVLYDTIKGENSVEIYRFKDKNVTIVPGKVGAPACAGYFEEYIALGAKRIMLCGGGGVLDSALTLGRLIIVDSAIRDEGTSYHYIEPSREIKANSKVIKKITQYLDKEEIPYMVGKVWTTDAFYRETKKRVALRKEEGALLVEMEQAAMIAVSQYRKVAYGAIIYGGDDVSKDAWDSRNWRSQEDIRLSLTHLCVEIVQTLEDYEETL